MARQRSTTRPVAGAKRGTPGAKAPTRKPVLTLPRSIVRGKAEPAVAFEAKVSRPKPERVRNPMNGTESRYADVLDARIADGTLIEYWYEDWTFRLADDTRYNPDFVVALPDGTLEIHEVKGRRRGNGDRYWVEEDARVKLRVFARQYPFRVRVVWESAPNIWHEALIGEAA
jgi:hypothetical protein